MQGVDDYDDCVVDHIGKANANQDESKIVAHFSAYVVIKEKKEDTKDIDGRLIGNVLVVYDLVLPLILCQSVS